MQKIKCLTNKRLEKAQAKFIFKVGFYMHI